MSRPGGAPFMNGLPASVVAKYRAEHPEEQRTAAKEDSLPQHVLAKDLPMADWAHSGPLPHPYAVSEQDHPSRYPHIFPPETTFSLRHVPLADLNAGHVHDARCYEPTEENEQRHNVDPEEGDVVYVKHMAQTPEHLPALVLNSNGTYFGGGHRTAAWAEAGWTHVPAWVPDEPQEHTAAAKTTQHFFPSLAGGKYHRGDPYLGVPTAACKPDLELDRSAGHIMVRPDEDPSQQHPILCRRCLGKG